MDTHVPTVQGVTSPLGLFPVGWYFVGVQAREAGVVDMIGDQQFHNTITIKISKLTIEHLEKAKEYVSEILRQGAREEAAFVRFRVCCQ